MNFRCEKAIAFSRLDVLNIRCRKSWKQLLSGSQPRSRSLRKRHARSTSGRTLSRISPTKPSRSFPPGTGHQSSSAKFWNFKLPTKMPRRSFPSITPTWRYWSEVWGSMLAGKRSQPLLLTHRHRFFKESLKAQSIATGWQLKTSAGWPGPSYATFSHRCASWASWTPRNYRRTPAWNISNEDVKSWNTWIVRRAFSQTVGPGDFYLRFMHSS